MIATGVELKINGKKATFHDTDFQKAFEMQLKVKIAGFYNEDAIMGTYDGAIKSLSDGESFMTMLSVVSSARFTDEAMQYLGGVGLSKETNRIYFGMPNCAYIPKDAKNMEGAKAFINWFIKRENLQKFYGELKMITPYMGIEAEMYPVAADFKKGFDALTPYVPQLLAAIPQVGTYVAPMIAGEKKPYDIVEEMQQDFAKNAKAAGLPAYQ